MQTIVSTKYQVVIPKEARKKIKVQPGQKMNVEVVGNRVSFSPAKNKKMRSVEDYSKQLGGIWEGVDVDKYIDEERNSWND